MFKKPKYYFNRELSWLKFNQRVLSEAIDPTNPLLEQLRFIAIAASNLDEFFMIRVAGLRHQVLNGVTKYDAAHMDAKAQLKAIDESVKRLVATQYEYLAKALAKCQKEGLRFVDIGTLDDKDSSWLEGYFKTTVFPVVTPLAVDSGHPFPFLANRTINTIVSIRHTCENLNKTERIAIIPIPSVLPRIIELPKREGEDHRFVYLEDLINAYADHFFVGYDLLDRATFRVTRDADLEIDEEDTTNLLTEVEESLRQRRRGDAVRLEVSGQGTSDLLAIVLDTLQLEEKDLYYVDGHLDCQMYFTLCDLEGFDHLRFAPFKPQVPSELVDCHSDHMFETIKDHDILVHHPYESFEAVEDFIAQAAKDPQVLAIKQTLYRVSSKSRIIASLIKAAENGKQVTVLMEVKARFDEENNIHMARRLEKAGCHVIYGLKGLKTHSKILLVVRREEDGIRRYVHLATGNYNGKTARLYTDLGLFTSNDEFGNDASKFFNLISGYSDPPEWSKFIVAPLNLRERIVDLIDREIQHVEAGDKGHIIAKMNSLLDKNIIAKLYEASSKGVKIDLVIRGICTLRPGIEGVSDTISVRSIVGRFLEHHRLFYFYNGGREDVFLSSADWMPRNLNERVELMIPVEGRRHKERVKAILDLYLNDNQKAHIMRADGSYRKVIAKEGLLSAQEELMRLAEKGQKPKKMTDSERFQPMLGTD